MTDRRSRKSVRTHHRSLAALLALLGATALVLSASVVPAGAVLVKIKGHAYGVTPIDNARGQAYARAHENAAARRSDPRTGHVRPRAFDEAPEGGTPLIYHGGPVMHSATTHVIYWDPNKEFSTTTKSIVEKFFTDTAHDSGLGNNVFGVNGQFTDKTGANAAYNSTFSGALPDETTYPANGCSVPAGGDKGPPYTHCLTDKQLQEELQAFTSAESLPKGPTQLYFLLLPHKVTTCFPEETIEVEPGVFVKIHPCSSNFFCAYHSFIEPGAANELIYAAIPFSLLDTSTAAFGSPDVKGCQDDGNMGIQQPNPDNGAKGEDSETRFADVALKYTGHEFSEAQTDPLASAWFDKFELENGDKCNGASPDSAEDGIGYDENAFLPTLGGASEENNLYDQVVNGDHFYTQSEWDNVAKACRMKPVSLTAESFISSPAIPLAGEPVSFTGSVTDPYGAPKFTWHFGDGEVGAGSAPAHSYAVAGEYKVRMTVTDGLTGSASVTVEHTVVVEERENASFTITPSSGASATEQIKFNGAASSDPDGRIERYKWTFGDGQGAEGEKPEHKYAAGTYVVTLTVEGTSKQAATATKTVTIVEPPNSSFTVFESVNRKSGAITVRASVHDPGTFALNLRFANGKFGVFASRVATCKGRAIIKLAGKCRPAFVTYAKGSATVFGAGTVTFTIKPSAAAKRALAWALKRKGGVTVTGTLTFQSAHGGPPVTHALSIIVRLKKR